MIYKRLLKKIPAVIEVDVFFWMLISHWTFTFIYRDKFNPFCTCRLSNRVMVNCFGPDRPKVFVITGFKNRLVYVASIDFRPKLPNYPHQINIKPAFAVRNIVFSNETDSVQEATTTSTARTTLGQRETDYNNRLILIS